MKKSELVYDAILSEPRKAFTQAELALRLGFSLSTVNVAVKKLEEIGAVRVKQRGFVVEDFSKALLFWATHRALAKDIVYSTRVENIREAERSLPAGSVFTAYTAFRLKTGGVPADYSEVYAYVEDFEEVKKRFPPVKGPHNLFVMVKPPFLVEGSTVSFPLLFVDLWNLREWYAKEFLKALEVLMHGVLE